MVIDLLVMKSLVVEQRRVIRDILSLLATKRLFTGRFGLCFISAMEHYVTFVFALKHYINSSVCVSSRLF